MNKMIFLYNEVSKLFETNEYFQLTQAHLFFLIIKQFCFQIHHNIYTNCLLQTKNPVKSNHDLKHN
jgi:hypothetical protein